MSTRTTKITVKPVAPRVKKWRFEQSGKGQAPWSVLVRRNWADDPTTDYYSIKMEDSKATIVLSNDMIQSIAAHLAKEHQA